MPDTPDVELLNAAADEIAEAALPGEELVADPPESEAGVTGDGNRDADTSKPTAPAKPPVGTALGDGKPAPEYQDPTAPPAPDTLRGEIKEIWGTLPKNVQEEFIKRENDFRQGYEAVKVPAALGQGFTKLVEPYAGALQEYGINPWEHVSNLLQGHAVMMFGRPEQKLDIIRGLCQDAGIDVRALAAGAPAPFISEDAQALRQELARLQSQVTGVAGRFNQADAAALEQQIWAMGNNTEQFPLFWEAAPMMVRLFQNNPGLSLEDAYKQASVMDPAVRQKLVDLEVNARLTAKQQANSQKADKARSARGVRVRSGSSAASPAAGGDDLDKMLHEAFQEIQNR